MKLVIISDTHQHQPVLPAGDVLVCCGDFCSYGTIPEAEAFNAWIGQQDFAAKIVIAGNHELCLQSCDAQQLLSNCTYLFESSVTIDGIKFYGLPWQPEFCNWAFNVPPGPALAKKWENIPQDTDVLITHGPPHGILDRNALGDSVGCKDLLNRVKVINPTLHVFGHIHPGYGMNYHSLPGTTFVNASVCNEYYQPTNPPVRLGEF